jgi:hypothetical protein
MFPQHRTNRLERGSRVTFISGATGVVVGDGARVTDAGHRIAMSRVLWPLGSVEADASFDGRGSSWHESAALTPIEVAA